MLTKLLELLKQGEGYTVESLAEKLNCDRKQVRVALYYLESSGYIRRVPVRTSCGGNCSRCHGCMAREIGSAPVMWELAAHSYPIWTGAGVAGN